MAAIKLSGTNTLPHWTERPPTIQPVQGDTDPAQVAFAAIFDPTTPDRLACAREVLRLDQNPLQNQ